jgi:hypothetical protein
VGAPLISQEGREWGRGGQERKDAAKELLPYCHPKLASVEQSIRTRRCGEHPPH